jgi:1-acyl-sn-glycerol-3-phosphate acyltransferase
VTAEVRRSREGLPHTDDLRHPATSLLHSRARQGLGRVMRRIWDVEISGATRVPVAGPVVMVGNHIGFLDGPLMAILGPRPVHALTKQELFTGPLGAFLRATGQIPQDRDQVDPLALRTAIAVLRAGGLVGVFPESTRGDGTMRTVAGGAAYLAMVTGAPVLPVSFLGTRLPGSVSTFPPRGSRLVVTFGEPFEVAPRPWPRRTAEVRALTERIRLAVVENADAATRASGIELPGPLPTADERPLNSKERQ